LLGPKEVRSEIFSHYEVVWYEFSTTSVKFGRLSII
jgi:hypothetical protein